MNRIEKLFSQGKSYTAYLTAGDGGIQKTLDAALALIKGGVNMLEIGMPFSDPVADGPVIQRAAARALHEGTSLQDVLWLAQEIRKQSDIPLILFSYLNPVLSALPSGFLQKAKNAGIDGLLLVDCPLEESHEIRKLCEGQDLAMIYVITSATSLSRIQKISQYAKGFLYYACRKGTTGMKNALPADFSDKMQAIKSLVKIPVIVGFGISTQEMAQQVYDQADGVVVGSFFVKALEDGILPSSLTGLADSLL